MRSLIKLARYFEAKLAALTNVCTKCGYDNPYMDPVDDYICAQCRQRSKAWSGKDIPKAKPTAPKKALLNPIDFFKKLEKKFGGKLIEELYDAKRVDGKPHGLLSRIEWKMPSASYNDILDFARHELGKEHLSDPKGLGEQWVVNSSDPDKAIHGYPLGEEGVWWLRMLDHTDHKTQPGITIYTKFVKGDFE